MAGKNDPQDIRLVAYEIPEGAPMEMKPSPVSRMWMELTKDRLAFRCLPMLIANQHGWTISNPVAFEAMWDGTDGEHAIQIRGEGTITYLHTNFGHGVISFLIPYLFRTEEGFNMWCRGPVNRPKDGISALEGIIESDWIKSTFTMNWKFTATNRWIKFSKGEPFCMIFPIRRADIEAFSPTIELISKDPELEGPYRRWQAARGELVNSPEKYEEVGGFQKHYFQGITIDGVKAPDHQTKLTLKPFTRK